MKICTDCKIEKSLLEFYFCNKYKNYISKCKVCKRKQRALYKKNNFEKCRNSNANYYKNNKQKIIKKILFYQKFNININYKLSRRLRDRFNKALKKNYKTGSAVKDLGCSVKQFKLYIQKKFTEGMSWNNYGLWHLDHIKPLATFDLSKRKEVIEALHYTNYQPLWAKDNLSKGAKYE